MRGCGRTSSLQLQLAEPPLDLLRRAGRSTCASAPTQNPVPTHRRVAENLLGLGVQRVEPGGDERLHGFRQRDAPRRARRSWSMRTNSSA